MPDLTQTIIILILALLSFLISTLLIREYHKRLKSSSTSEKLLDQTQQKSYQIIHQAIKKAQSILSLAEIEGLKIIASSKVSSGKLDKEYEDQLSQSIQSSQELITKEASSAQKVLTDAEKEFISYLNELKLRSNKLEEQAQQEAISRMNQLFANFENRITEFLFKTETSTTQAIQLELRSTRQLIETYKSQQLALIDENIIAMMEQTLASVLGKKLSLKDQLDLVYEALEKAKIDKFIV
ncbi:hypothetical protein A3D79_00095 [Candidatus Daviesbacteria bacterium RIFCSPHIGHO2_02_FULL_39_8]|nr:MAG: hypothetical protein A3D79_00095 [Candidatus Daviesbacteria bacterium RIFCSPHIGHO2_02_FULL_39_8]